MAKHPGTYSELNLHNSFRQQHGKPKEHKIKDVSSEQQVTYTELKNSKSSQQQRRSKNTTKKGSEQQVTYTELKNSKPSQHQQHRQSKDAKRTGAGSEQQVTYTELTLYSSAPQPGRGETGTGSWSPPWRLVAGVLMVLGFVLVVTVASMTVALFRILPSSEAQNQSLNTELEDPTKNCSCSQCQGKWFCYKMSCYHYSAERKSWKESKQACASQNSSLLQIDSREELEERACLRVEEMWQPKSNTDPPGPF
ncbi:NKG2-A/NKG2-B type II integral membrane protein-like [Tachyglossus aculeatus]|uniref:NKG2-A/NKG2-B type II integral membrane protein-like n=1 Tax=Tachyglossus aculeatus TaxID=9261 RepID=UPI0018F2BD79|nr:NKG2-A/NKG2-B type II integral membrane protein-like [Tachyglossus aculeatus]